MVSDPPSLISPMLCVTTQVGDFPGLHVVLLTLLSLISLQFQRPKNRVLKARGPHYMDKNTDPSTRILFP